MSSGQTSKVAMLRKVRKLLNKAESVAGTPESDVFQQKAFDLIAKYGIDEAAALGDDGERPAREVVMEHQAFRAPYAREKRRLFGWVASALHCSGVILAGGDKMAVFGVTSHVERVRFLYSLLEPQMLSGARRVEGQSGTELRVHRSDWMLGFARTVAIRLKDAEDRAAAQHEEATGDAGAALVLVSDEDRAAAAAGAEFPNATKQRRSNRRMVRRSYLDGVAAGESANIGLSGLADQSAARGELEQVGAVVSA